MTKTYYRYYALRPRDKQKLKRCEYIEDLAYSRAFTSKVSAELWHLKIGCKLEKKLKLKNIELLLKDIPKDLLFTKDKGYNIKNRD